MLERNLMIDRKCQSFEVPSHVVEIRIVLALNLSIKIVAKYGDI